MPKYNVEAWEHVDGDPPGKRLRWGYDGDHIFDAPSSTVAALEFVAFYQRETPGILTYGDVGWDEDKWQWTNNPRPRVVLRVLEVK